MKNGLFVSSLIVSSIIALSAHAEKLTYSSGTGFFVGRDGYLLTSLHVVGHCKQINVVGAVPLAEATLTAQDADNDLALLKSDATPGDAANLASGKSPLKTGDPVVVVGYPGQSWQTQQVVTRQAQILDTKGPHGEEKWLQFSDALAFGNSGGPLLDESGNVVGVVAAKGRLYADKEAADSGAEALQKFDIAVSLPVIRKFLDDNNVRYQDADSGIYLSADHVTDNARRFVVNVRCRVE